MERLGEKLEDTLEQCGGRLGLRTVGILGQQMISTFEFMHKKGHLYSLLKLDSFLVNVDRTSITLVDFGRTRNIEKGKRHSYCREDYEHREVLSTAYQGGDPFGPNDDLEAAAFLLLYLLQGREALPWPLSPNIERKRNVLATSGINDLPPAFRHFFESCFQRRGVEEVPEYEALRSLLSQALEELGGEGMWEDDQSRTQWDQKLEDSKRMERIAKEEAEERTWTLVVHRHAGLQTRRRKMGRKSQWGGTA